MTPLPRRPPRGGYSTGERIHRLIEWLRAGERLTTPLAAEALGVSRRTVARDLAHLRDVLGLCVEYDTARHSYVLADGHDALPFLAFPSLAPVLLGANLDTEDGTTRCNDIHVRFSSPAIEAYLARGGHVPEGSRNADGSLDARFAPHSYDEFMSYVLSRGHHIEVLGPPAYRHRVHMEIRRMLSIYEVEHPVGA